MSTNAWIIVIFYLGVCAAAIVTVAAALIGDWIQNRRNK